MQQGFQPRAASQDEQNTYIPEQAVANSLEPCSYSAFTKLGAGESDSGIDMSQPGLSSQSSTPSNPSLVVFSSHGRYGVSPTNSTMSRPSAADNSPQIIYPNSTNGISPDLWPKPTPGDSLEPWSPTAYHQPADTRNPLSEVTAITNDNRLPGPLFEGNGKCQLLLFWFQAFHFPNGRNYQNLHPEASLIFWLRP